MRTVNTKKLKNNYADARAMLDDKLDADMREMVKEEMNDLKLKLKSWKNA